MNITASMLAYFLESQLSADTVVVLPGERSADPDAVSLDDIYSEIAQDPERFQQ